MPRLLLFDLDDTLLHSDKTISTYTQEVLQACRERGMLLAFATARGEHNIQPFVVQVRPDLVISCSGAMIRKDGIVIHSEHFTPEETTAILAAARRLHNKNCLITVDTLERYYSNFAPTDEERAQGWSHDRNTDFSDFHKKSLKICLNLPSDDLAQQIAAEVPGCSWLRFTGGTWYQFARARVTKATAAARISELLGVDPADMIAFGDDYSDVDLLRYCGTGVAVANAIPEVKAVADVIVGSQDDDGPAAYLAQTFLGR